LKNEGVWNSLGFGSLVVDGLDVVVGGPVVAEVKFGGKLDGELVAVDLKIGPLDFKINYRSYTIFVINICFIIFGYNVYHIAHSH